MSLYVSRCTALRHIFKHEQCHKFSFRCVFLQQLREDLMTLRREVLPSGESSINLPVNLRRLIWNAQERFQCNRQREGPTGGLIMSLA